MWDAGCVNMKSKSVKLGIMAGLAWVAALAPGAARGDLRTNFPTIYADLYTFRNLPAGRMVRLAPRYNPVTDGTNTFWGQTLSVYPTNGLLVISNIVPNCYDVTMDGVSGSLGFTVPFTNGYFNITELSTNIPTWSDWSEGVQTLLDGTNTFKGENVFEKKIVADLGLEARTGLVVASNIWNQANVAFWGAGNGTNDTTAIQNCIDSGGGEVFFPGGTYWLSNTITVPAGTLIYGAGIGKTIINSYVVGGPAFYITNVLVLDMKTVKLRDFSIFGEPNSGVAIQLDGVQHALIENLHISGSATGFTNAGILLNAAYINCFDIEVRNCNIYQCGGDGVRMWQAADTGSSVQNGPIRITGGELHENSRSGFAARQRNFPASYCVQSFSLDGVLMEGNGTNELVADYVQAASIRNCHFESGVGGHTNPLVILGGPGYVQSATIEGCTFSSPNSPDYLLDLSGTGFGNFRINNNIPVGFLKAFINFGAMIHSANDSASVLISGNGAYQPGEIPTTIPYLGQVGTNQFAVLNSNFGVGKTNATTPLDVDGEARSTTLTVRGTYDDVWVRPWSGAYFPEGATNLVGSVLESYTNNLTIGPALDYGTIGKRLTLAYWNGGGYVSAVEYENPATGSNSSLLLMKTEGFVGVRTNWPGMELDVNGNVQAKYYYGNAAHLSLTGLPSYVDNAAAKAGGLVAGALYRTGGDPDVVCVVH